MKYLIPIVVFFTLIQMVAAIAGAESVRSEVNVQYSAPSEGHYVHGEHCIDGRVF